MSLNWSGTQIGIGFTSANRIEARDPKGSPMPLKFSFTRYNPPATSGPDQIGISELGWSAPTVSGYGVVYIGSGRISSKLRNHRRRDT